MATKQPQQLQQVKQNVVSQPATTSTVAQSQPVHQQVQQQTAPVPTRQAVQQQRYVYLHSDCTFTLLQLLSKRWLFIGLSNNVSPRSTPALHPRNNRNQRNNVSVEIIFSQRQAMANSLRAWSLILRSNNRERVNSTGRWATSWT